MESALMPTILRSGPYRLFFYASDRNEPQHVHVEHEGKIAKFWLKPVRVQRTGGLRRAEMNRIQRIIESHHQQLVEAWNDYFGE
jgi:hypothetical protein